MPIILTSEATKVLHSVATELTTDFFRRRFVCITTAAVPYQERSWIIEEQNALRALGATTQELELSQASPTEAAAALKDSDCIYVHGGNTFFLLQEMQRVGFKDIVASYLASGRSYLGSSAGSLVAGPRIDVISSTDDPTKAPKVDASDGLGLIDIIPFVHFDMPSYFDAFRASFEQAIQKGANILPLRNDQFLLVDGKNFRLVKTHG